MREYEKEVYDEMARYANVIENWPIYDSIVICNQLYGSENNIPGWYNTFWAFAQRDTHSMFKSRTDSTAGRMYCNQTVADTMPYAYKAHSFGIEILGQPFFECQSVDSDGLAVNPITVDAILPGWWGADLARHIGVQFRVQQDIRFEAPAMALPAGAGVVGGGVASAVTNAVAPAFGELPYWNNVIHQGIPLLRNRQPFPEAIGIPRTGSIEAIVHVSPLARHILSNVTGPHEFVTNSDDGTPPLNFAFTRYIIRVSLFGHRLVQQRDQYHR